VSINAKSAWIESDEGTLGVRVYGGRHTLEVSNTCQVPIHRETGVDRCQNPIRPGSWSRCEEHQRTLGVQLTPKQKEYLYWKCFGGPSPKVSGHMSRTIRALVRKKMLELVPDDRGVGMVAVPTKWGRDVCGAGRA
jgi:hypothetical protein